MASYNNEENSFDDEDDFISPEKVSLKSRFNHAIKMQHKAEAERIKAIKSQDNFLFREPHQRDVSVNNLWVEALNDLKLREMLKKNGKGISSPLLEQRENYGIVKKRVQSMVNVSMQQEPTPKEVSEVLAAAKRKTQNYNPHVLQDSFDINSMDDSIALGDTRIFTVSSLDAYAGSYIASHLDESRADYVVLPSGVYEDDEATQDRDAQSALRVVIVAFRHAASRSLLLALRISGESDGYEFVDQVFGLRKIAAHRLHPDSRTTLFDRVVNVLPASSLALGSEFDALKIDSSQFQEQPNNNSNGGAGSGYNSDDNYGYRPSDNEEQQSEAEDYDDGFGYRGGAAGDGDRDVDRYDDNLSDNRRDQRQDSTHLQQLQQYSEPQRSRSRSYSGSFYTDSYDSYEGRESDSHRYNSNSNRHNDSEYSRQEQQYREYEQQFARRPSQQRDDQLEEEQEEEFNPHEWDSHYSSRAVHAPSQQFHGTPVGSYQSTGNSNSNRAGSAGSGLPPRPIAAFSTNNSVSNSVGGTALDSLHNSRQSSARNSAAPSPRTPVVHRPDLSYWQVSERDIADPVSVVMLLDDLRDPNVLVKVHVGSNLFVLEGRESSTLFTGTLKSTSTATKYMVHNDKIFQWIRGVYMKGWLMKWPRNSQQKLSRQARRFFVLKDDTLSYHKNEIRQDDDMLATPSTKFFHLDPSCSVKVGVHNMQRCFKVKTPQEKLWLAVPPDTGDVTMSDQQLEARWVADITQAIDSHLQLSSAVDNSSAIPAHHTDTWHHESLRMKLLSVDASVGTADRFIKVSLFRLSGMVGTAKGRLFRGDQEGSSRSIDSFQHPESNSLHDRYSVEIGTERTERLQLDVVLTNESPALPSALLSVKVYGDEMLLFGGENGFLAVGVVGRTTGVAEGKSRKVVYCIACKAAPGGVRPSSPEEEKSRGNSPIPVVGYVLDTRIYPHSSSAKVTVLCSGKSSPIFAAADSEGSVSLWHLDREDEAMRLGASPNKTNLAFYYKIKPVLQSAVNVRGLRDRGEDSSPRSEKTLEGERVLSLQFIAGDAYLVVGTNKRLLILVVQSASSVNDNGVGATATAHWSFLGWTEVDRVILRDSVGLFGLHVVEKTGSLSAPSSPLGSSPTPLTFVDGKPVLKTVATKIVYWRVLECEQTEEDLRKTKAPQNKYRISRFEWSSSMILSALKLLQYF